MPRQDTVGAFHQGNALSQLALRRYLLTRAIGASIVRTVHWLGVGTLLLAVLVWLAGIHWLSILIGLFALLILIMRTALSGLQRRISGIDQLGPSAARIEALVGQTRKSIRSELKRVGLPSTPWGPTLIGFRLIRPVKRVETLRRLGSFDLSHVVPVSTLDELHLLLRQNPPI